MGTVLVADDSKTIRTICEWVFKGSGHRVVVTSAADEVLHAAETERPDVVVLDYTLPDQDSYEVCRTLKSDGRFGTVAVLMLGGTFEEFDEDRAARMGADDTLLKPFRADEMAEKVEALAQLAASGNVARPEGASAAPPAPTSAPRAMPEPPRGEATPATPPAAAPPSSRPSRFQFPSRGGSQPAAGGSQAGAGKRFTFPTAASRGQAPSSAPAPSGVTPQRGSQRPSTPAQPAVAQQPAQPATPATPPPSSAPAMDEAAMRQAIQAAVKEQLPGIVKGILKELITREVTPQLQRWVEEKVTVVAERMLKDRLR